MTRLFSKILSTLSFRILSKKIFGALKLPSGIILLLINLIPIVGVFAFDWNTFDIIILYWIENIIVGIFNALRMWYANDDISSKTRVLNKRETVFFFIIHYGMFTFVHGVFVMMFFGPHSSFLHSGAASSIPFILALILSKGFSFFYNFLYKKEYLNITASEQMMRPYGRIVVIHLSIFVIGFISIAIPLPRVAIILFITLKILIDLVGHQIAHKNEHIQ